MKTFIEKTWNRFSTEIMIILAIIMTSIFLILTTFSVYNILSYKYKISQNGYQYVGRCIRSNTGVSVLTEDGKFVILYDILGPIEIELEKKN